MPGDEELRQENTRLKITVDRLQAELYTVVQKSDKLKADCTALERQLNLLLENMPHSIFILDSEGVYQDIYNFRKVGVSLLGHKNKGSVVGKTVFDVFSEHVARERLELINLVLTEKEPLDHEYEVFDKRLKERRRYRASIIPLADDQVLVASVDVTTSERTVRKMQEYVDKLEADKEAMATELVRLREREATKSEQSLLDRIEKLLHGFDT